MSNLLAFVYTSKMARKLRNDVACNYYHCMNRANARLKINFEEADYELFMRTLKEAQEIFEIDILAFVVMNNHFHLVIYTKFDGQMSRFMKWLTETHTKRWHDSKNTVGTGHLYQGRYKSVLIKDQIQLEIVLRYVERNPLTAGLVKNVLDWKYSSLYQRYGKTRNKYEIKLSKWPHEEARDYLENLAKPLSSKEIEASKKLE